MLLVLLLARLLFAPQVNAGTYCAPTTVYSILYIGCSRTDGLTGYCRTDSVGQGEASCPLANCSSYSHWVKYSHCRKIGGGWGDTNDACNGNRDEQPFGYDNTQCWVNCNENNWTACTASCGGGTHTNDCGTTEACNTQSCCSITAPTNPAVTKISTSTWQLTWTKGTGGASQRVYAGTDKANVESNCASAGCTVKDEAVDVNAQSYNINSLTEGVVYYYRIVNYSSGGCTGASSTLTNLSSCDTDSPSLTIQVGDSATLTANVATSTEIGSTAFTKSGGFINVNPVTDNSYIYSTLVSGVSVGNGTVTADVKNPGGTIMCTSISNVTVNPQGPWWQVKDGDVSSPGDITTGVKGSNLFNLAGDGGYPGVPSYSGTTDLTSSNVSATGWLTNSVYAPLKAYDSSYFFNQVPTDTAITSVPAATVDGTFFESGGSPSYGYYWYQYDGSGTGLDLTINSATDVGSRKVILLVKSANLFINAPINLTDGQGFFMVVVEGNISVDPTVGGGASPTLEGMYLADGQFYTGAGSTQLWLRGTVTGHGGMSLQRDLGAGGNPTTPAELFEYAPDQVLLYPTKLSARRISWKEVAP